MRATRCQVFVHSFDLYLHKEDQLIDDPYHERKSIFVLCYQDGSALEGKVKRICSSFPGAIFEVNIDGIDEQINQNQRDKEKTRSVIRETKNGFKDYLKFKNDSGTANSVSVFKVYKLFILKEKTIFTYLNMLKQDPSN